MPEMKIQQLLNLAVEHHQAGRLAEAEAIYRQILVRQPNFADALHLLGVIAQQKADHQAAVELICKAISIKPGEAIYYYNLGNSLKFLQRLDDAVDAYRTALNLKPDFIQAYINLGHVLHIQNRLEESFRTYRAALDIQPGHPEIHNNLGTVLKDQGLFDQAVEEYRTALKYKPDFAECLNNLGIMLSAQGRIDDAMATYRKALNLKPDYTAAHSNLVYGMYHQPEQRAQTIHEELLRWNQQHAAPLKKLIQLHNNDHDPERKLRIGYVSADFCDHASALFLDPLLRSHEHKEFEIFCYAHVAGPDAYTQRFESYADHWRNIAGLSDQQVAEQIRRDGIDILVDLKLHTSKNRLLIFARKPTPIQATWLGYPGSTGLETIDYRLTDTYLDPPGLDDEFYSEKSIYLPDCYWCYDPLTDEPQVGDSPELSNGYVTFGCLNKFDKVNDAVLELWAKVLSTTAKSHLLLLAPQGQARKHVLEKLSGKEISHERIEFVERCARGKYLELYNKIDVVLDTLPYNGHTTTLDSLWMGVPVITLVGKTAVGRGGKSILTNVGLPELIAQTPEEYVQIAVKLAKDMPRLAELRKTLRQRMEASPLMDAKRFARNVEAAYREMWRGYTK
ncbi:MAG TPA: tetratricopeptide repeat protein [Phycisphaerae bacterium]|nr:tetratricopeptide repeat protein [Phycisphaerae bacterium]